MTTAANSNDAARGIAFDCPECAGSGREHRHTAVDVYRAIGTCPDCNGSGEAVCGGCYQAPARHRYEMGACTLLLCEACMCAFEDADSAFFDAEEQQHREAAE